MDIDGPPPTASASHRSTATSTPRPSSSGIQLPGIRTLPGFQIAQHESPSGSGLGSSLGRDRDWNGVSGRESGRDQAASRDMEWERQSEWRERERVREGRRGFESGLGSGTGGGMGYSGVRIGAGKERELSLPMPTPVSGPLAMSPSPASAAAMSMTPVDERPLSRTLTSSVTLNSILSLSGPSEPLIYAQPRPVLSGSRSLSSPSPFAHGVGGSGLPPIGHGLLAARRKVVGGTSGEMGLGMGGGFTSGGTWAPPGQAASPSVPARSPSVATSSAASSSLAHLYAAASASGPYSASPTASSSGTAMMSASRPSSSSSTLAMNGYGYGRSRTDSNASVNTHISVTTSASGSLTPTSHHRMPMSPPASVSTLNHPRPQQFYAAPPPSHRSLMSPPPLPPSRQQQPQSYRMMSPPAPSSTSLVSRGNDNPYLAARNEQTMPSSRSPTYTRSPQVENRRMEPGSPPPIVHRQRSPPTRVQAPPASTPLNSMNRHLDGTAGTGVLDAPVEHNAMAEVLAHGDETRDLLDEPESEEDLSMEIDAAAEAAIDLLFRSRIQTASTTSNSLDVPVSSTPHTRPDMLRPPALAQGSTSSPAAAPSAPLPSDRLPSSASTSQASTSEPITDDHPRPVSLSSPTPRPAPDALIPPPETLIPDDSIRCICGISIDDGFSIACDVCSRWCHTACFKIGQESVPEEWVCWVCAGSSPNPNGHTAGAGGGGRGKGKGKGRGAGAGAGAGVVGRQWTPWAKEEVEERRVWARAMQMERLGLVDAPGGGWVRAGLEPGGVMAPPADIPGAAGKRKRRASAVPPFNPPHQQEVASVSIPAHDGSVVSAVEGGASAVVSGSTAGVVAEEEDLEPWTSTYVSITQDVITDPETRARLRSHAQRWRGVSALVPDGDDGMDIDIDGAMDGSRIQRPVRVETMPDPDAPNVAVRPLAPFARGDNMYGTDGAGPSTSTPNPNSTTTPTLPPSSLHTLASASFAYNPLVLPPSYGLHTTSPISSKALIAPFVSHITPSSTYLADPLNAYVHLGMPKPYVHLMGPPLEVALDARGVGGKARFARRGCWPNAVVRPVLCENGKGAASKKGKERQRSSDGESEEEDGTQLAFGVFALRDLKAGEEVVLGWEWDDGHVVHKLPALLQTPSLVSPTQVPHIKDQMANLLHALASNFVSCACGAKVQLGGGCTGHRDPDAEQGRGHHHREYQDGYCYDAESDTGNAYDQEAPRGRTRERLSVREKRMREREKQQACALASMARFVGRDDRHPAHSHSQYRSGDSGMSEDMDLGPLVGSSVKRGIRAREGLWGGVENGHGRYRKREGEKRGRNQETNGHGRMDGWHRYDDIRHGGEGNMPGSKNGEHSGARRTTVAQEPRPPDPHSRHVKKPLKVANNSRGDEVRMPPKMRMRKKWMEMHETSHLHDSADGSIKQHYSTAGRIEPVGAMDVGDEEMHQVTEDRRVGLGITFEHTEIPVTVRDPSPLSVAPASPAVIIDDGPGSTSQMLMPPPPLPTPLVVAAPMATVSEPASSSPMLDAVWPNDSPRSPPRSPGSPIVGLSPSLPRRTSTSSDGETQTYGPTPPPSNPALSAFSQSALSTAPLTNSPSPLISFANLSLLSPAVLNQVRMQVQTHNTVLAALQVTSDASSLPVPSLPTSITSYFPADVATSTAAVAPKINSHSESSPSTFSLEQMDLNRGASQSPSHATKDDKNWSPLQRRDSQSFVRIIESPRLSNSEPRASREPTPSSALDGLPLAPPKSPEENLTDDLLLVVPSKVLDAADTCETGVRVEYVAPPEPHAAHLPCAEVAQRHSPSPAKVDFHTYTPDKNARSRSVTPASLVITGPASMELDAAAAYQPDLDLVSDQPEAERGPQSDESEDIDFPPHRWRRKRKRVVSMDSEAGKRSQSPPYKVVRDSAMPGVNVHTSPRSQREPSEPLPANLREIVPNQDAAMHDSLAAEKLEQASVDQAVKPVDMIVDDSAPSEGYPATIGEQEVDHMAVDETALSSIAEISPSENTPAPVPLESSTLLASTIVPAPEPSPQPEAPRKVKLSLADFARRKKQQRQEEERQLEMQKALNPPPLPPATTLPPMVHAVVPEPLPTLEIKDPTKDLMDTGDWMSESRRHSTPAPRISSPTPQSEDPPVVKNAPILLTASVDLNLANGTSHKDSSPVPSPMSVSPEETAPPPLKFVFSAPTEKSRSPVPPAVPSLPILPEFPHPLTDKPTEFSSPQVNGSVLKSVVPYPPAAASSASPTPSASTPLQPSDEQERQAKQELIEAMIPPPPSTKPSRFGPPLARPLVGLVVLPPPAKPSAPFSSSGRVAPPDQRSPAVSYVHEMGLLPPHPRRQSQTQEDGEIRENAPPASPAPASQPSKHTWFGRPLPDPPPDPKDLKGWNQYYREVYNLTGSFDPPGVAVRPGMHPPPKGPRSLNLKGETVGNVNGNSAGQTAPSVPGPPSRSSLPIPTGPRFGVRPGARGPIPDDATRAALAKAKVDVAPPLLAPTSAPVHLQSPPVTPGPPPLSARIGPPVPRGSSVDYGERERDDSDRRGGRDYRPYTRGRGRGGGGVWRK